MGHVADRPASDPRKHVGLHRGRPLLEMLSVRQALSPQIEHGIERLPERGRPGRLLAALLGKIAPLTRGTSHVDRTVASSVQRDEGIGTKAAVMALAADGHPQHPATRSGGLHHQAQAATVLVHARRQPVDVFGLEPLLRSYPPPHCPRVPFRGPIGAGLRCTLADSYGR